MDENLIDKNRLDTLFCLYKLGGEGNCREISDKFGKNSQHYNSNAIYVAERVHEKTGCPLSEKEDDDGNRFWSVLFQGPDDTIFEGGFFKAILTFPEDFPQNPPEMKFITEMFHPNIYKDGKVCISILHSPGVDEYNLQELAEERWRPSLGVEHILLSVISMLNDPNCDSPANVDAAVMFRNNKKEYEKKVRQLALKSMEDFD